MSELFSLGIIGIGCLFLGYKLGYKKAKADIFMLLEHALEMSEEAEKEEKKNAKIEIYVEEKDNMLFVYDSNTHQYITHAEDGNDLVQKLKTRFPGKSYMASEDDLEKILNKTKV